jgi:hypothetical protein
MTRFHQVKSGERIELPLTKGRCAWTIRCCDCGLEHVLLMVPSKRKISIGAWRMDELAALTLPRKKK